MVEVRILVSELCTKPAGIRRQVVALVPVRGVAGSNPVVHPDGSAGSAPASGEIPPLADVGIVSDVWTTYGPDRPDLSGNW